MRYAKIPVFMLIVSLFFVVNLRGQDKSYTASVDSDGVQRVKIVGGEYYYDPNHIIVKVNVPVELTIEKTPGITPHTFVIKAPDAGIDININITTDPKTVKFTPVKTGRYQLYCDKKLLFFKSHREKGMEGVLEVIE